MSTITKPALLPQSADNQLPIAIYVLKVSAIDDSDSKTSGAPMLALDYVILHKDGSDVLENGFVVSGRKVKREYFSFSEKALPFTIEKFRKMGVSDEALEELNDSSDKEWVAMNLKDRCFQATVGNEELYRASDGRTYDANGLERVNKTRKTDQQIEFIKSNGNLIKSGSKYVVLDYIGAATEDGTPL